MNLRTLVLIGLSTVVTFALRIGVDVKQLMRGDMERLREPRGHAIYAMLAFIEANVPTSEGILAFRPAEVGFYLQRPVVHAEDPRLIPLFVAKADDELDRLLRERGIQWILDPGSEHYYHITKTQMASFLRNDRYARLVHVEGDVRLYRLR